VSQTATRQTAEARREAVLEAARHEFAQHGIHGASTDAIARRAGISQPYLFRLFGTKKKLFVATVERCMADTLELFRAAAGDLRGEEALEAMGAAYAAMVTEDRTRLLAQLQAYAACDDPEVREAMRAGFGSLHLFVETVSGLDSEAVSRWFGAGMLLNVLAAMDIWGSREPWATRLLEGLLGPEKLATLTGR
jgi:AcrR family transcriptional regulator